MKNISAKNVKKKKLNQKSVKIRGEHKDGVQNLLSNLYSLCSSSPATFIPKNISSDDVGVILKQAVGYIKLMNAKSKMLMKKKKGLQDQQVTLLKKLISLLKESSKADEEPSGQTTTTAKENATNKKFDFLGFRSPRPAFKDSHGYFTAESLLVPSPPPSPSVDSSSSFNYSLLQPFSSCTVSSDIAHLDFVFKPDITLLPAKMPRKENDQTGSFCVKMLPLKIEQCLKKLEKQNRTSTGKSQNVEIKLNEKNISEIKVIVPNGINKDRLNLVKRNIKLQKPSEPIKVTSVPTTLPGSRTPKKKEDAKKTKVISKVKNNKIRNFKVPQKNMTSKTSPNVSFVPRKPSRIKSSQTPRENISQSDSIYPSNPKIERFASFVASKAGHKPQQQSVKSLDKRAPEMAVKKKQNVNSTKNKRYKMSAVKSKKKKVNKATRKRSKQRYTTKSKVISTTRSLRSEQIMDAKGGKSDNQSGKHTITINSVKKRVNHNPEKYYPSEKNNSLNTTLLKTNQLNYPKTNLFYPVHPFSSPDLPIHFIPVDPDNVPDFFPLFSPVIETAGQSQVWPSFVRVTPPMKNAPEYVFTKAIHSQTIPQQTLSADFVIPRILPGIASTSKSPLLPGINTLRNMSSVSSNLSLKKKNTWNQTYDYTNTLSSAVLSGATKSHTPTWSSCLVSNSTTSGQTLPAWYNPMISSSQIMERTENQKTKVSFPSDSTVSPINIQQKIHYCQKCNFETPKLGVLKRHELSHSKPESPPDSSEDIQILDAKIYKTNVTPYISSVFSSVRIHSTTQPPVLKSSSQPAITPSEDNDIGIKIVSTESLKDSSDRLNNFNGFMESTSSGSLQKMFPSVTITPLIQPYDD